MGVVVTGDDFVAALGCPACVRVRRTAYGRALHVCHGCRRSRNMTKEAKAIEGWRPVSSWAVRVLIGTEAAWACLTLFAGTRDAEHYYFAPDWVADLLYAGDHFIKATVFVGDADTPLALDATAREERWKQVVAEAVRNETFRTPLLTVCGLGDEAALVAWLEAHVEAFAKAKEERDGG